MQRFAMNWFVDNVSNVGVCKMYQSQKPTEDATKKGFEVSCLGFVLKLAGGSAWRRGTFCEMQDVFAIWCKNTVALLCFEIMIDTNLGWPSALNSTPL